MTRLLFEKSVKNANFISAKGGENVKNDVQFVDNIFKYINEYDEYIKTLKNGGGNFYQ